MKKRLIFVFIFTLLAASEAAIERRAAFDCGSGKIKVQVADVDTESETILNIVYADSKVVRLSEDLMDSSDGTFIPFAKNKFMFF